jgi:ankyrin repeat protein
LPYLKDINIEFDIKQPHPVGKAVTPLALAAYVGNPEIVAILLAAGADVGWKSSTGETAESCIRLLKSNQITEEHKANIAACRRLLAGAAAVKALEAELG